MNTVLYSGPANVALTTQGTTYALSAEGENGAVKVDYMEKRTARFSGPRGYHKSTLDDQWVKLSLTPFDSWSILPALFPAYLGINCAGSATAGSQLMGVRPHDWAAGTGGAQSLNGTSPTTVYGLDGRLITLARTAVTKHPGLKLGVGQPLFTGMEIAALVPVANQIGATSGLLAFTNDPQAAGGVAGATNFTAGVTPAYGVPDYINGHWTGSLGSLAGFTALDAEDGWEVMVEAKYSPLTVQKRTFHFKLDSVQVTVKARLTGPSQTQLAAYVAAHTLGGVLTGTPDSLILTGPGNKTITVNDVEIFMEGSGYEFGGTKLSNGECLFVTQLDFAAGLTVPVMTFST